MDTTPCYVCSQTSVTNTVRKELNDDDDDELLQFHLL